MRGSIRVAYPLRATHWTPEGSGGNWRIPARSHQFPSSPGCVGMFSGGVLMPRPRVDQREPMQALLAAWKRGEGIEPEFQEQCLCVGREAVREAEGHAFGTFEQIAGAMVLHLYSRSLSSKDAITVARCLGEVVRGLRALKLLGTADRLRGGSVFQPRGKGSRPRTVFSPANEEGEAR